MSRSLKLASASAKPLPTERTERGSPGQPPKKTAGTNPFIRRKPSLCARPLTSCALRSLKLRMIGVQVTCCVLWSQVARPLVFVVFAPVSRITAPSEPTAPEKRTGERLPAQRAVIMDTSPLRQEILRVPLPSITVRQPAVLRVLVYVHSFVSTPRTETRNCAVLAGVPAAEAATARQAATGRMKRPQARTVMHFACLDGNVQGVRSVE
jgi:hypothetical protein